MKEVGIDITDQKSKTIDPEFLNNATMAVTLCGDAKDSCPVTPGHVKGEHGVFDDRGKSEGTEEGVGQVVQRGRDGSGERVRRFAEAEERAVDKREVSAHDS